ncbi:MAG: TetR/AcrR family transcriptional regulator [Pleurocapsa minor GSE-CHR-MK-17-07R]|jgi:AcrR family transcriptional regulator|nr:TetR/AcrR family transcriptional regulator [Pleurocapsa minor GSE-CHR-MK 17-07R]
MNDSTHSLSRERVLDAAERLFSQRGYSSVTLRDIAQDLDMKQASLYYHVKGKEELFVEVTERSLQRHREGLREVMQNEALNWQGQLHAVTHWLLSQPPMNVTRVIQSDMPEISKVHADQLMMSMYRAMLMPLEQIFMQAQQETDLPLPHAGLLVGAFLSLIEGIRNAPTNEQYFSKDQAADQIIEVLIRGLQSR